MSLLVLFHRKLQIKGLISDKNYQLMQKKQELMDLQSYAASISDGSVSMNDLMNSPATMFGRMNEYMVYAHNASMAGAQQTMGYLQGTGQIANQQGMDATQMQQQNYLIFKNLYEQQKAQVQKQEEAVLQQKNKALDNECLKIEQQLKQLEAEYDSVKGAVDNHTKDAVPQYA
jgi:hypothetical protein